MHGMVSLTEHAQFIPPVLIYYIQHIHMYMSINHKQFTIPNNYTNEIQNVCHHPTNWNACNKNHSWIVSPISLFAFCFLFGLFSIFGSLGSFDFGSLGSLGSFGLGAFGSLGSAK